MTMSMCYVIEEGRKGGGGKRNDENKSAAAARAFVTRLLVINLTIL
jgi:hypothetical protein